MKQVAATLSFILILLAPLACGKSGEAGAVDAAAPDAGDAGAGDAGKADAGKADAGKTFDASADATVADAEAHLDAAACGEPEGTACNPIMIRSLPFHDERDTRAAPRGVFDSYSCKPSVDESGGEFVYSLSLEEYAVVSAKIGDDPANGVDIDIHLLGSPDPDDCLERANAVAWHPLQPGTYYIVADTYVAGGSPQAGPYTLEVTSIPLPGSDCAMTRETVELHWGNLDLPATGKVAFEAHLVTDKEQFGGNGWPDGARNEIARHYAVSEEASGFVTTREEPWCPYGEGGSQWGQGSGVKPPPGHEAWYICMYWKRKPPAGTRMIVTNPENGRSVVAIAGYETGPGSSSMIGGLVEEVHRYLGTRHEGTVTVGFAADQGLLPGPIHCGD